MKQNNLTAASIDESAAAEQKHVPRAIAFTVQGPLPSSMEMRGYADINPELPMRIVAMAEKQAAHRQALEKKVVEGQLRNQYRGQIFSFILSILNLISGTASAIWASPWAGFAQIALSLLALAALYIHALSSNRAEREKKWTEAQPK